MRGVRWCSAVVSKRPDARRWIGPLLGTVVGVSAFCPTPAFADDPRTDNAQAPTVVREQVDQRTEKSATFELSDGTMKTKLSASPVHYRDAGGDWVRIDPSLKAAGTDRLTNAAAGFDVSVPRALGNGQQVKVVDGSSAVGFSPRVQDTDASVSDATASFDDALPGADVSWTSTNTGVKELITLRALASPRTFVYDLHLSDDLSAHLVDSGAVEVRRGSEVVGSMPAPWMRDAGGAVSFKAGYSLSQDSSGDYKLTLTVDDGWLSAADRSFPVDVDPTYYPSDPTVCGLDSANPDVSSCTGPQTVGRTATGVKRAVYRFDSVTQIIPRDARVLTSRLSLGLNAVTGSFVDLDLHQLTRGFSTPTWARGDSSTPWTSAGGDFNATRETRFRVIPSYADGWISIGAARLVQGWLDGTITNQGLLLKSATETDVSSALIDDGSGDRGPNLEVRWTPRNGDSSAFTQTTFTAAPNETLKVNPATGNAMVVATDVTDTTTPGPPLSFVRYYNTLADYSITDLGDGWTEGSINGPRLMRSWWDDGRILRAVDGSWYRFDKTAAGSWTPSPQLSGTLTQRADTSADGPGFDLTDAAGTKRVFDNFQSVSGGDGMQPNNYLKRTVDSQGRATTVERFTDGADEVDPAGRRLQMRRESSTSHIVTVTAPGNVITTYTYTGTLLTKVTKPGNQQTTYAYDSAERLIKIIPPSNLATSITYLTDGTDRVATVKQQTDTVAANDKTTTYNYPAAYRATVLRPDASRRKYVANRRDEITRQYNPDAKPTATPSGALYDLKDGYTQGNASIAATVTGASPDGAGLRTLGLEEAGRTPKLGSTTLTCGVQAVDDVCPLTASSTYSVNAPAISEGAHSFRVLATDDEGNASASSPWTVSIDRTAPPAPKNFRLSDYDATRSSTAIVIFDSPVDPVLPDGSRGAEGERAEARFAVNGGGFSAWAPALDGTVSVSGVSSGASISVEARTTDRAGNQSAAGSGAVGVQSTLEDPDVHEAATSWFTNEYGVTHAVASAWINVQEKADDIGEAVSASTAGPNYAGTWFDNTNRKLVIDLTSGGDTNAAMAVAASKGVAPLDARVDSVSWTQTQLETGQTSLEGGLDDLIGSGKISVSRNTSDNSVEIEIATSATSADNSRIASAAANASVRVTTVNSTETSMEEDIVDCSFPDCDPPLRGGVRIASTNARSNNKGVACSAGFIVKSRSTGAPYLLTAGHCVAGFTQDSSNWAAFSADHRGFTLGAASNPYLFGSNGDAGLISIANSGVFGAPLAPIIFVKRSNIGVRDPSYTINGAGGNSKGRVVCMTGAVTASRCGKVSALNRTVRERDPDAGFLDQLFNTPKIRHLGQLRACGIRPGDSGGPVYSSHRARGLMTAVRGCRVSFQGAVTADDQLNVDVIKRP